jgi:hypothetical protein
MMTYWFSCLYYAPSWETEDVVTEAVCFADLWDRDEFELDTVSRDSQRDEPVDEESAVVEVCRSSLLTVSALNTSAASLELFFRGLSFSGTASTSLAAGLVGFRSGPGSASCFPDSIDRSSCLWLAGYVPCRGLGRSLGSSGILTRLKPACGNIFLRTSRGLILPVLFGSRCT